MTLPLIPVRCRINARIDGVSYSDQPVLASPSPFPRHIETLTAANFQPEVAKGMTLVEFYSPYCIHCKRFAPTFKSLVDIQEHLEEFGFKIRRVNCVTSGGEPSVCEAMKRMTLLNSFNLTRPQTSATAKRSQGTQH